MAGKYLAQIWYEEITSLSTYVYERTVCFSMYLEYVNCYDRISERVDLSKIGWIIQCLWKQRQGWKHVVSNITRWCNIAC